MLTFHWRFVNATLRYYSPKWPTTSDPTRPDPVGEENIWTRYKTTRPDPTREWTQPMSNCALCLDCCIQHFIPRSVFILDWQIPESCQLYCVIFTGRQHSLLFRALLATIGLSVCLSLRLSVRLSDAEWKRRQLGWRIFTDRQHQDSSFQDKKFIQKFDRGHWERGR